MEKGILFLTIAAGCLWILLDEFFGTKKISGVASQMTPTINNPLSNAIDGVKDFVSWDVGTKSETEKNKDASQILKNIEENPNLNNKVKDTLKESVNDFYNYYES